MRSVRLPILVAVGALLTAGTAAGQAPPPDPGVGQISQYIEVIPSAGGGTPTIVRKKGRKARESANLSAKARREIESRGGQDADVLVEVASSTTSPTPRPPRRPEPKSPKPSSTRPEPKSPEPSSPRPPLLPVEKVDLTEAVRVAFATTSGRARLVAMGLMLVVVTAALIVSSHARVRAGAER